MHRHGDGRLQHRMVAGADRRPVARGICQGRDADRDAEGLRHRRGAWRHGVRHERRLRSRRDQVGQGARLPRRHAGRDRAGRQAAGADSGALAKIPRPAVPDPHLRLADPVDLPRLPAGRDRRDRQAPDRRGRPRRRRQAQPDFARPRRARFDPARQARLSRHRGASARLRRRRDLGRGGGTGRTPRPLCEGARARPRGEILQHPGGREQQGLLPRERAGDVSLRPAAASPRHRACRALPPRLWRPPAGFVLRRDRRGQFRRHNRPGLEARHRLQRLPQVRRLPARLALFRRAGQAHGRGSSEGHRHVRAEGARPGRGRARVSRPHRGSRRRLPRRAFAGRRSARSGRRRLRRLGLGGAGPEQRRLRRARGSTTPATAPPKTPRRRRRSARRSRCSTA